LIRALILILIFVYYANPVYSSPSASVLVVFTCVFLFPQRRCLLPPQALCALLVLSPCCCCCCLCFWPPFISPKTP
jgi:hypothetical protein